MSLHRRGEIWHAFVTVNGRRTSKSLKTTDDELAIIKYGEMLQGIKEPHRIPWKTFCEQYQDYAKANKHTPETIVRNKLTIEIFNNLCPIRAPSELTTLVLERYKSLRTKKAPGTINKELGTLKAMARRAMEWGYAPYRDLRVVKKIKEDKSIKTYFEQDHIEMLRSKMRDEMGNVLLDLAIYTGFRRKEMAQLRWEDIDFKAGTIAIKGGKGRTIKDKEERRIRLHPKLKIRLLSWYQQHKHPFVLLGRKPKSLSRRFKRLLERAKLTGSLHTTRHTAGTHLVRKLGIEQAKEVLGHASTKTTERYSHQKSEVVPVEVLDY